MSSTIRTKPVITDMQANIASIDPKTMTYFSRRVFNNKLAS